MTAPPITPEQLRRVRILLDRNVFVIAWEAGVDPWVLFCFQGHRGTPSLDELAAVRRVLEAADVEFLSDGSVYRREPAQ